MSWLTLELAVARAQLAPVEELLQQCGAVALTLIAEDERGPLIGNEPGNDDVLEPDPGTTPVWRHVRLQALFALDTDLTHLRDELTRLDADLFNRVEIEFLQEADWQNAMREHAVEAEFAGRLRLRPKDRLGTAPASGMVDLFLDPGLAFGTGGHPTTRLCLASIAELTQPGMRVLDFGCGSGILGIAAALLGARVSCVDHDEQALVATRQNALYNGLNAEGYDDQVVVMGPTQWQPQADRFDLVVANILAGPLMQLAPDLQRVLAVDGTLVLSGLLQGQVDELVRCYTTIEFQAATAESGWIRLVGRRRGS